MAAGSWLNITQESMVTVECEIPRRYRRIVIGARGYKVQAINTEFDVQVRFPYRFAQAEAEVVDNVPVCDVVRITGKPDNAEAAKQALLNLVPITIKVDIPNDLHSLIIGYRGHGVKELMDKYDVSILLSRVDQNLDYITITGIPARVEKAKEVILERCKNLEAQRRETALKCFKLKIEVDSEYHPKIIGYSGVVIKKITSDNNVHIYFPRIGDPEENIITIAGCKKNVHAARDDLMKVINKLEQRYSKVISQVPATHYNHAEISRGESPTLSIDSDISGCEGTDITKRTQELSSFCQDVTNMDDDTKIESTEEVEKVETQMQMPYQNTMSCIAKHIENATTDSRDHQAELVCVILKQEKEINELTELLNDQVLANKALKIERTQLIIEIDSERAECDKIVHENQQKCDEKITKMSDTIKDTEAKLIMDREEKSKLVAVENNESSKRLEELLLKYQTPEEKVMSLSNEPNENFKLCNHREQLQDFTLTHTKTTDKLINSTSNNEESSDTVANRVDFIDRLETVLKNKDDKISKLSIDLSDALQNNRKLSRNVQSLRKELFAEREEICQAEMNFSTYNMDKNIIMENTCDAAELNKIQTNICDLKEKLMEITEGITQHIGNSSLQICEMLDTAENTSDLQLRNSSLK